MASKHRAHIHARNLQKLLPWTKKPLVIGAPMRILSGPELAVQVSEAGGLGFIGPGAKPQDLSSSLDEARKLLSSSSHLKQYTNAILPFGVGFQTWAGDLSVAKDVLSKTTVAVVWLFAPRNGQEELDQWTRAIREASPQTQIWIQVASVRDAVAAVGSGDRPDALVVQGADAGGHSLTQGAGLVTLLPEVSDRLEAMGEVGSGIPLIAAGGIIDARAASAALTLGAAGVTIGTRLLASRQAKIHEGYQAHILAASDGGQSTVRTQLYNHLRGTTDWPAGWDARGLANSSWREYQEGVPFETLKERHDELVQKGAQAWGEDGRTATYAGTGIGLISQIKEAGEIVNEIQRDVTTHLQRALEILAD